MSKITVAGVRSNVAELLDYSLETKKRNFLETVELQIGLKVSPPLTIWTHMGRLANRTAMRTEL